MNLVSIVIALGLLALALLLIAYFISLFFSVLAGDPAHLIEKWVLVRHEARLRRAQAAEQANNWDSASKLLQQAFVLRRLRSGMRMIELANRHHLRLIEYLLGIGAQRSINMSELETLERLLNERYQLLKLLVESQSQARTIHKKRQEKGKGLPGWAQSEYTKKISETMKNLKENREQTKMYISRVFSAPSSSSREEITYH